MYKKKLAINLDGGRTAFRLLTYENLITIIELQNNKNYSRNENREMEKLDPFLNAREK